MYNRGESHTTEGGQVVTHCTLSAGAGEPQTTVIFRSGDWGCDLLVVARPFPGSHDSGWDRCESTTLERH